LYLVLNAIAGGSEDVPRLLADYIQQEGTHIVANTSWLLMKLFFPL